MQFCPELAIQRILQSYGERHGLTRASVWTFDQDTSSLSLYAQWPDRDKETLTLESELEVSLTLSSMLDNVEVAQKQNGGQALEIFFTPLLSSINTAGITKNSTTSVTRLIGVLHTERAQVQDDTTKNAHNTEAQQPETTNGTKTDNSTLNTSEGKASGDNTTKETECEACDDVDTEVKLEDQEKVRKMLFENKEKLTPVEESKKRRLVASEVIMTILADSPRWGVASPPSNTSQLPFTPDESRAKFMELFEVYRKKPQHDLWEQEGRLKFETSVRYFMERGVPIPMVLPAFPFKSSNTTHKVVARHADVAEKLALEAMKQYCEKVRAFYPPGIALVIVSDGRVYASQFDIGVEYVLSYQREIKALNKCPDISIVGLGDFMPVTPENLKRDGLLTLFGQSMDKVDNILRTNADFNRVYCGFKKFMCEELHFAPGTTVKQRRTRCAAAAHEMMKSNDAYGRMVECLFPHHIRLSIHAHSNVEKVGITLVRMTPGSDMQWGTPWHNCAVLRRTGEWELVRKNMALVRGYELNETEEGLLYFIEREEGEKRDQLTEIKGEEETKVYVGDMLPEVTDEDIRELFPGEIINIEIVRPKKWQFSHAFLTFTKFADALWVVENINGASVCGGVVRVEFLKKERK